MQVAAIERLTATNCFLKMIFKILKKKKDKGTKKIERGER